MIDDVARFLWLFRIARLISLIYCVDGAGYVHFLLFTLVTFFCGRIFSSIFVGRLAGFLLEIWLPGTRCPHFGDSAE
jgi:hypothetical protein